MYFNDVINNFFFFLETSSTNVRKFDLDNELHYRNIQTNIEALIPKSKTYIFGSRRYGLAEANSDLNVYIQFGK